MIVVFDGLCNFCNGWVRFVIRRDREGCFRFAASQSPAGAALLDRITPRPDPSESLVLIDGEHSYQRSDAVLRIVGGLDGPWRAVRALLLVPAPVRDACYSAFARRRYRWFGKRDACPVPEPAHRDRFIS